MPNMLFPVPYNISTESLEAAEGCHNLFISNWKSLLNRKPTGRDAQWELLLGADLSFLVGFVLCFGFVHIYFLG